MAMLFKKYLFFILFGIISGSYAVSSKPLTEKKYTKEYDANGNLKAEGWKSMNSKTGYWTFYHINGAVSSKGHFSTNAPHGYWYFYNHQGRLIKEGHFKNGSAENWWIFYDLATKGKSKFQFKYNQKNGFALRYKKNKLVKVEEYIQGQKVAEWTSLFAFKLDNPNVSLQ